MSRKVVKLTLQQAEVVEWALGAMDDYWTAESEAEARDGEVIDPVDLPSLEPHKETTRLLILSPIDDVNEDLLYRLEDQMSDMVRQAVGTGWGETDQKMRGDSRASRNAAARIRHAIRYGG